MQLSVDRQVSTDKKLKKQIKYFDDYMLSSLVHIIVMFIIKAAGEVTKAALKRKVERNFFIGVGYLIKFIVQNTIHFI